MIHRNCDIELQTFGVSLVSLSIPHIVYKETREGTNMPSKGFHQIIMRSLVAAFSLRKRPTQYVSGSKKQHLDAPTKQAHLPIFTNERRYCYHCSSRVNNIHTHIKCDICDKYSCLKGTENATMVSTQDFLFIHWKHFYDSYYIQLTIITKL